MIYLQGLFGGKLRGLGRRFCGFCAFSKNGSAENGTSLRFVRMDFLASGFGAEQASRLRYVSVSPASSGHRVRQDGGGTSCIAGGSPAPWMGVVMLKEVPFGSADEF